MPKGTIRRLFADVRSGLIRTEQGEDVFFHRRHLKGADYKSLKEGQQVEFEVGKLSNGYPQAVKVRLTQTKGR